MTILEAVLNAVLGYGVVFFGLSLLLAVVVIMGKVMSQKKAAPAQSAAPAPVPASQAPVQSAGPEAPGSAGEVRLYNVSDKDAAMLMAIVANKLGKPVNQLRFKSIKEVK